jgi:tRNA(adenine34) deaminase
MQQDHERFMGLALRDAKKSDEAIGRGIGAVVVYQGAVVGGSGNRRESLTDPTAHAEVLAIRKAARKLGRLDLSGCTLYTTFEPCAMCCGAILAGKVSGVVVGARQAPRERPKGGYTVEKGLAMSGWSKQNQLIMGVRAQECAALWQKGQARRAAQGR